MEEVLSHFVIVLYPSPAPPVPVASPPLLPLITHFKAMIEVSGGVDCTGFRVGYERQPWCLHTPLVSTLLPAFTHNRLFTHLHTHPSQDHVSAPTTHTLAAIKRSVPGLLDVVFGRTTNEYKTGTVPNEIRPFVSHGLLGTMDVPTPKKQQSLAQASNITGTLTNALGGSLGSPPKSLTPNQNAADFCLLIFSRSPGSLLTTIPSLPSLTVPLQPGPGYYTAIPPQTIRWLLDPEAVLECARRSAGTNEDYHVPRCTRALWGLDTLSSSAPGPDDMVTDSNPTPLPLSFPGLEHSPLSSYVSGTLGFGEVCTGDKTKAKAKISVEEDVIIR